MCLFEMTVTRGNWFEHFFHGIALDLWRNCVTAEQTRAEADFLEAVLGKKTRLLDVPCGNGRHALELARRGCRMTGVDLSREFIAEARAAAKAEHLPVDFVETDMRRLRWRNHFDGALCMGNSFGYLEFPGMVQFVRKLGQALRRQGSFVIETGCAAESLLPNLNERDWYQMGDILFTIQNRYDAQSSCLETEATFVRNGKSETRRFWHWVYTVGEIRRLLSQAGLGVDHLYSSLDRRPFQQGNPRLLIVGHKI